MQNISKYLIKKNNTIKAALQSLSKVGHDTILFVINDDNQLIGSVSDGDIRRGLLNGLKIDNNLDDAVNKNTKYIRRDSFSIKEIVEFRNQNITVLPVIDNNNVVVDILNFRHKKSYLPIDVVIMAGGKGLRLKPLTNDVPKPLLRIKNKCIIDYNFDRLKDYGAKNFFISVNYLGNLIKEHFDNRGDIEISTKFIYENKPLGTVGAISKIKEFKNEYVLITNSDIITNIDYEDFLIDFIEKDADMSVVCIPYEVQLPYAIIKKDGYKIQSFEEKPIYEYFANGGIYLIKKHLLDQIPKNKFYNATEFMQTILDDNLKLICYPLKEYWIDIGEHHEFERAKKDLELIKL